MNRKNEIKKDLKKELYDNKLHLVNYSAKPDVSQSNSSELANFERLLAQYKAKVLEQHIYLTNLSLRRRTT